MAMGVSYTSSSSFFLLRASSSMRSSTALLLPTYKPLIDRREACTIAYGTPWKLKKIGPLVWLVPLETPCKVKASPSARLVPSETPLKVKASPSARLVPPETPLKVKTSPSARLVLQETSHVNTRASTVIYNEASWLEAAEECEHKMHQALDYPGMILREACTIAYGTPWKLKKIGPSVRLVPLETPCKVKASPSARLVPPETPLKVKASPSARLVPPETPLKVKTSPSARLVPQETSHVNTRASTVIYNEASWLEECRHKRYQARRQYLRSFQNEDTPVVRSQHMQVFTAPKSIDEKTVRDKYVSNGNASFHLRKNSGEVKTEVNRSKGTDTKKANANEMFSAMTNACKFQPSNEVNHNEQELDTHERLHSIYDKVLVVDNVTVAKEVVKMLTNQYKHLVHACDTEVASINVKEETPVDHGEVICFSIYSGSEANFGNGKSCIWVDVLDGGGMDILAAFSPFFEDQHIKKVWHNYSFDAHVIENSGLKLSGFHADTMHMARLWNSSRRTDGGYSLAALTGDHKVMCHAKLGPEEKLMGKISMKTIFGKNKKKSNGSDGKTITISPVEELQREERKSFISYSCLDAISTLKLYESLKKHLLDMPWKLDGELVFGNMFDFYIKYWRPFGELLVQMETEGMLVNRAYLAEIEKVAKSEQEVAVNRFRNWATRYCPDAKFMNVGSDIQVRQLLFGGIPNRNNSNAFLPKEEVFKIPNVDNVIKEGQKAPRKLRDIELRSIGITLPTETYTASGWPSVSGDALKILAGKVSAEYDFVDDDSDLAGDLGTAPEPLADAFSEIRESVDSNEEDTSAYGTAFHAFDDKEEGKEACHAIASLVQVGSIDSLISSFILPLQGSNISGKNGRVHCSLNINTEIGRLSTRRPHLQNQPALEKDRYKIRQAFVAAPGNSLIVADYGQLELRILAHLANCKSMLDAFEAGGDFHSRTAMNMYPHIREALEQKQVILEWHPQPGEDKPPVPLLKDAFGAERRKAKMLNFSIAYGKTPVGLARDWKVSVEEAKHTVDLWYRERQEVLKWQQKRKKEAIRDGCVYTLLGRARRFPNLSHATRAHKNHIKRAAINTPVQGSAADVAMCAMLQISRNKRLKELGWKLLLQVHDEVILEGPSESAEVAKAIVVECMSKPFFDGVNFLKVDLSVDVKTEKNWYAAK